MVALFFWSGSDSGKDEDGNDGYASDKQIHATVKGLKKVMVQLNPEHWETEDMLTGVEGGSMPYVCRYRADVNT